ncbi:LysR family transcriptional regulator [Comamonas sp. NLF-1-9]|uniref:LysR family transcriptional regulator n=1 Tax=Comamonas sp. NLF-1-9 TaxID=2853163 RepID=UPI001C43A66F|nr:LysR family transcriptional regulator [Comamonas sp. NLF-1-9]QXL83356.1 LysR family transcriptional regulator [Comamonas sp. NLF-1-9]
MNWNDCEMFCHVVEHGGFSAAAHYLGHPKSSISSAVQRLEQELDTRLLERTTRSVRTTEAGEILYKRSAHLFTNLHEACNEALSSRREVAGTLRIAAPYEFGAHHLGPVAGRVMETFPHLQLQIDVEHRQINPHVEPYDIVFAMLEHQLPSSSIVIRRMFSLERGLFTSPVLLQKMGQPLHPADLKSWPLVVSSADTEWTFTDQDGVDHGVPIQNPRVISANADFRLQAATNSFGITRVTATFCAPAVARGELVRVRLPGYTCEPLRIYALLPGKRMVPEKVRYFLEALAAYSRSLR